MSIKINKEISKAIQLLAETEETGNLYGYARLSTIKQDLTEQLMELEAFGVSLSKIDLVEIILTLQS